MKRNRTSLRVFVIIFLAGGILCWISFKLINGFRDLSKSFEDDIPRTYSMPSEDSTIISNLYLNRFKVEEIINFKQRDPISVLLFDSSFYLIIVKMRLKKTAAIDSVLHYTIKRVDRTTDKIYSILDLGNSFQFQFQSVPLEPLSDIFLTLSGDSLSTVKSDSAIRFHFIAEDFSLRYADNAPFDIYATGREGLLGIKSKKSIDLMLLIRSDRLYFLLMTPIEPKAKIASDLLYNIISGQ